MSCSQFAVMMLGTCTETVLCLLKCDVFLHIRMVCFSHEYRQKLTVADFVSIFLQLHAFIHLAVRKQLSSGVLIASFPVLH